MKIKYIIITAIAIIAFCVFLVFYRLKFDFYEYLKAKEIIDILIFPIVSIILIKYIYNSVKQGDVNWKTFPKEIVFAIVLFGIFYITIMRSVLSCGVLFINCTLKEKEIVTVNGRIIEIINVDSHGKVIGKHQLTIKQNDNVFVFESNKKAIKNYKINQEFKIEMKKGIFNILYR